MTSSIRYLEVAGRTMPASRFTSMSSEADGEPAAVRDDQRLRLLPGVRVVDLLLLCGIVGAGGDAERPAPSRPPPPRMPRNRRRPLMETISIGRGQDPRTCLEVRQ